MKATKNSNEKKLKALSENAIRQINAKNYDANMKEQGVEKIYKFGVAFCGKTVEVTTA